MTLHITKSELIILPQSNVWRDAAMFIGLGIKSISAYQNHLLHVLSRTVSDFEVLLSPVIF